MKGPILVFFVILFLTGNFSVQGEVQMNSQNGGSYSITSVPPGAYVKINGIQIGITPLLYIPNSSILVPFSLDIGKPGYYNITLNVSQLVHSGAQELISLNLIPMPKTGEIHITSHPDGCLIQLDTNKTVPSPYTFTSVPEGKHSIVISKTGYKSYHNSQIQVEPDSLTALQIYLIPNYERKELVVTTSPPDANIIVDGIYRGTSLKNLPLYIGPLGDGQHTVLARLQGYRENMATVSTKQDLSTNLHLFLNSVNQAPTSSSIRIKTIPIGSDVTLNGIWVGTVPETGFLILNDIPPNRYKITLSLTGYQNYSEWVFPIEGETITIDKKLEKMI